MIKVIRDAKLPPPKTQRGERLKRLDPRTRELLDLLPTLKEGDAFDVPGTVREISTVAGSAEARSARETDRPRRKLKVVDLGNGKVRVFILESK